MTLRELKDEISQGSQPDVEVHGIDPSLYLIFSLVNGQRVPLLDQHGSTLKFPGRSRAFDTLRELGVLRADFVHKSAFDEMIGFGNGLSTEYRQSVNLAC